MKVNFAELLLLCNEFCYWCDYSALKILLALNCD